MRYILLVLSDEGALSRSDPSAGRAKAGRTGAPRNGRRPGGNGGALGGAAPCLGRARCLAARGGYVNPASGVPIGALAPPTAPSPRAGIARDWQTSDALRRENAKPCPSFRGACALAQANPESRYGEFGGLTPLDSGFAPSGAPRNDGLVFRVPFEASASRLVLGAFDVGAVLGHDHDPRSHPDVRRDVGPHAVGQLGRLVG
jgi:hypothetical protein